MVEESSVELEGSRGELCTSYKTIKKKSDGENNEIKVLLSYMGIPRNLSFAYFKAGVGDATVAGPFPLSVGGAEARGWIVRGR